MPPVKGKITKCGLCHQGKDVENICGKLYMADDVACHKKCMQYSAKLIQYKFDSFGGFKILKVLKEITRGRSLKCFVCKSQKKKGSKSGATCGCAISSCSKSYHFFCAHQDSKAITRRIEVVDRDDPAMVVVKYRVFCGPEHFKQYENNETEELRYNNCSDDEEDDEGDLDDLPQVNLSQTPTQSPSYISKSISVKSPAKRKLAYDVCQDTESDRSSVTKDKSEIRNDDDTSNEASSLSSRASVTSEHIEKISTHKSQKDAKRKKSVVYGDENKSDNKDQTLLYKRLCPSPSSPVKKTIGPSSRKKQMKTSELSAQKSDSDRSSTPDSDFTPSKKYVYLQADPGDFLVAFVVSPDLSCDLRLTLKELGGRMSGLPADHILVWPHSKQLGELMLYYLRNLTDVLREGDGPEEVGRLMFSLDQGDMERYKGYQAFQADLGDELQEQIFQSLIKSVDENLAKASEHLQCPPLGRFIEWKAAANGPIYVLFLLVTDVIDLTYSIRKRLSRNRSLVTWKKDTCLGITSKDATFLNTPKLQYESHSYEVKVFCRLLSKRSEKMNIHVYPTDTFIRKSDPTSVTEQLRDHFLSDKARLADGATAGNPVVFIGPVNHDIVNYPTFVRSCLSAVVEELLTAAKELCVILDVGHDMGIVSWDTLMPKMPDYVSSNVSSALDPKENPVSCVLIQISMSTDNLDNISALSIPDEETSDVKEKNTPISKTDKKKRTHNYMKEDAPGSSAKKKKRQITDSSDTDSD